MGKVKMKSYVLYPQPILCNVLKELCAIRDNNSTCVVADNSDIIALIEDIMFKLTHTPLFFCCNSFVCVMLWCDICSVVLVAMSKAIKKGIIVKFEI